MIFRSPRFHFALIGIALVYLGSAPTWAAPSVTPTSAVAPRTVSMTTELTVNVFDGAQIVEIQVAGNKRIEKEAILGKLTTLKNNTLDRDRIRTDIEALFKMGYFDDIQVQGESAGDGVKLTYRVRERPVISRLEFEGNERLSSSDLKEVIKVKEWSILDVNRVREDVDLIQKHYESKGFYLAKVSYDLKQVKEDEVQLTYKVNDFDKVQIKKITFLNNKQFTNSQLKSLLMETREGGFFSFVSGSGSFKESAFKNDLQRLTYWYLDHGYIKFRYENPVVTVSEDKRWLYISIYLDEGDSYKMGKTDFSGDMLYTKEELAESLILGDGDVFSISARNADIQKLTEMYQDLGYAFVNVIPKMDIHEETKTVDVEYHFEKGNLVHFNEINIVGNSKTYDKVIRRELRIYEGELFHGTNLRISKERVERLGFFAPGEVIFNTIPVKGRDDMVNIEITVKERSTGTITLGAGYGSIQKFFLMTQVSEINLMGRGQTISFQGQYAADRRSKSMSLGFTEPYFMDTRWSTGFDVFATYLPIPNKYLTRRLGFNIRLGYPINDDVDAFITYKNEGMSITEKADPTIDSRLDEGVLSSLIYSVVRDKRNNRFETTMGNYQSVSLETAGVGGDKKFIKWNLNNRFYHRLVGDLVFRNSTEYGQMSMVGDRPIPPSEKFYLGGPNNMKGYQLFLLGPTRINSIGNVEPIGGTVQMFSLFELEYPLIREAGLKWVFFYDVGNAFSHFPGIDRENFTVRSDAGFGLRWFSPIGPLRFEWGFPLKKRPNEDSPVFSFFIGPPF